MNWKTTKFNLPNYFFYISFFFSIRNFLLLDFLYLINKLENEIIYTNTLEKNAEKK